MDVIMIVLVAFAGGFIGHQLKIPVGGMIGSMLAVMIYGFIFEPVFTFPAGARVALQLCMGPFIGSRITKSDVIGLKKVAMSVVVMIVCMLSFNILFGLIMVHISGLDIATALFSAAPGGMMDMVIISADFDANYAYVALMQLSRLMIILLFVLPFYKKIIFKIMPQPVQEDNKPEQSEAKPDPLMLEIWKNKSRIVCTVISGASLGFILWRLGIPAGAMIGSMIGAAAFNIFTNKGCFPPRLRLPLQIISGIFIGSRMDRESLLGMTELIIPLILLFIGVVTMTFVTAFLVHKITGLELPVCLVASTPGGLGEMALLADDLKIDAPKVVIMHTTRLMSVIILFPTILSLVIWLF